MLLVEFVLMSHHETSKYSHLTRFFNYTTVSSDKYLSAFYLQMLSFSPSELCPIFFFPLKFCTGKAAFMRYGNMLVIEAKFSTHFGKTHSLNLEGLTFSANIPVLNVNGSFNREHVMMPARYTRAGEVRETADLISFLPASHVSTMAHYSSAYLWASVYSHLHYQAILVLNLDFCTSSSSLKWKKGY